MPNYEVNFTINIMKLYFKHYKFCHGKPNLITIF